jgi:hypothetical protein
MQQRRARLLDWQICRRGVIHLVTIIPLYGDSVYVSPAPIAYVLIPNAAEPRGAVLHLNVVDNSDAPSDQIRARFHTDPVPTTTLHTAHDPSPTPAGLRWEASASTALRFTQRQLAPAAAERRAVLVPSSAALSVRRP